eukprot:Skav212655  [mRNA]  locus=scaffold1227:167851:168114:+ [translate_table: standard]
MLGGRCAALFVVPKLLTWEFNCGLVPGATAARMYRCLLVDQGAVILGHHQDDVDENRLAPRLPGRAEVAQVGDGRAEACENSRSAHP